MAGTDRPPAFQWFPRDFASKMRLLQVDDSTELAYRRALDASWDAGAFGVGTEAEWMAWGQVKEAPLKQSFARLLQCEAQVQPDGTLVQMRMVTHRHEQICASRIRAEAGSKGGRKSRRRKSLEHRSSNGAAELTTASASASAFASASARETEPESQHLASAARTARAPSAPRASRSETPLFVQFYERTWPRRVKRDKAWLAWQSAVSKGAEPLLLIRAAEKWRDAYANVGTPEDKILHPASWLNGGCWKDDPSVPRPDGYAGRMDTDAASKLADEAVRKFLEE